MPTEKTAPTIPINLAQPNIDTAEGLLDRSLEIKALSSMFIHAKSPLVLAIDAPWGQGKTTFITHWKKYLDQEDPKTINAEKTNAEETNAEKTNAEKTNAEAINPNKCHSLYINAWENDFAADPLLPLIVSFDEWFITMQPSKPQIKEIWDNAKKNLPRIFTSITTAAAKIATLNALDLGKEYEKIAADLTGEGINSLFDNHKIKQASIKVFKEKLTQAIAVLPTYQPNLIIFIDELDRCKPTYAIQLLERIKHLFDIKGIVFVLAVNKQELGHSIQGVYGTNFNSQTYLKRFIDCDYRLPELNKEDYIKMQLERIDKAAEDETATLPQMSNVLVQETLVWLATRFSYSLRDINQLIARFRLTLRSSSAKKINHLDILVLVMLALLDKDLNLYQQYVKDASYANEVITFLFGISLDKNKNIIPANFNLPLCFDILGRCLITAAPSDTNIEKLLQPWKNLVELLNDSIANINKLLQQNTLAQSHRISKGTELDNIKNNRDMVNNMISNTTNLQNPYGKHDNPLKHASEKAELLHKITV